MGSTETIFGSLRAVFKYAVTIDLLDSQNMTYLNIAMTIRSSDIVFLIAVHFRAANRISNNLHKLFN